MASSVNGQYEPNLHCYWIPEWAIWTKSYTVIGDPSGQDGATCPLGITRSIPQEKFPQSHIIYPLLSKLVWSRWLYVGLVLFFACWWTSTSSRSINMQKKNLAKMHHLDLHQILLAMPWEVVNGDVCDWHSQNNSVKNRVLLMFSARRQLVFTDGQNVLNWACW